MDRAATQDDVRLRKGSSLKDRLVRAALGVVVLLLAVPGIVAWDWSDQLPSLTALLALPLGGFLIGVAALERNIAWIITRHGIVIGAQRPFGQVRKQFIANKDVAGIEVRGGRIANRFNFTLACRLVSGEYLISPPLPDVTRINLTTERIAELLGLGDIPAVANPLEATNAAMRLGRPLTRARGRGVLMAVVLVAAVCGLLFAAAFWQGDPLAAHAIVLGSLGLLLGLAFYKYSHRLAGTSWIIRHGEITAERIALTGRYQVDTIRGRDVESIDIERGNSKGDRHVITIRLRSGRRFRSPDITGEDQAGAIRGEIMRRLRIQSRKNST